MQRASAMHGLYVSYYRRLVRLSRGWTPDAAAAEDVAQEALARALEGMDRLDRSRPVWPWLKGIARHVAADEARRRARDALARESDRPSEDVSRVEDRIVVERLLAVLNPRQRRAVQLRYLEDKAPSEAAWVLGMSVAAFNQLLFRARGRLRQEVRRLGDGILVGFGAPVRWLKGCQRRLGAVCHRAKRSVESSVWQSDLLAQPLSGLVLVVLILSPPTPEARAEPRPVERAWTVEQPDDRFVTPQQPAPEVEPAGADAVGGRSHEAEHEPQPDRPPGGSHLPVEVPPSVSPKDAPKTDDSSRTPRSMVEEVADTREVILVECPRPPVAQGVCDPPQVIDAND